jgi:hypothetical protein
MAETNDNSNAIVRPPIALALAFVAGLIANWLYPLPFVPQNFPSGWIGAAVFVAGLALGIWAVVRRPHRPEAGRRARSLHRATVAQRLK